MRMHRTIWGALILTGNWRATLAERELLMGSMGSIALFLAAIMMMPALILQQLPSLPSMDYLWLFVLLLVLAAFIMQALLFVLMNKLLADQFQSPAFLWLNPLCPLGMTLTFFALYFDNVNMAMLGCSMVYGLNVVYFIMLMLLKGDLYGMRFWYQSACALVVATPFVVLAFMVVLLGMEVNPYDSVNRGTSALATLAFIALIVVCGSLYLIPQSIIFYRAAAKAAIDAAQAELASDLS